MQPLQIIFFKDDTVKAHLVNCYIGGFPKLRWNEYGNFSNFPLKNEPFNFPAITPSLHEYTECLSISPDFKFVQKYTMIIFWSKALTKSYPDFIKLTKEYSYKNNINFLYVNSDNLLLSQE